MVSLSSDHWDSCLCLHYSILYPLVPGDTKELVTVSGIFCWMSTKYHVVVVRRQALDLSVILLDV